MSVFECPKFFLFSAAFGSEGGVGMGFCAEGSGFIFTIAF